MKSKKVLITVAVLCLLLSGCGREADFTTSVTIGKNGDVTNVIYESFEGDNYDLTELTDMATSEISSYNAECLSDKVLMESAELIEDGSIAKMVLKFVSYTDYESFNKTALFYGTVQDAVDRGYSVSADVVNADGEALGEDSLTDYLDKHVVITKDKSNFVVPFNISYATKGVTFVKKEADLSSAASDEVILLLSK